MEWRCCLLLGCIIAVCFYGNSAQRTVCEEEAVADIVFMVDGSWSIGTKNFEQIRRFLFTLVDSFDVGPDRVRIGLVQYSTTPHTEFLLNTFQNKQDILEYISTLPYKGGETKTGLGLDFLLTRHFLESAGSRANQDVPQIAVVITDGQSQDSVAAHATELRRKGITLYAIGIKDADEEQLKEIANQPQQQHVYSVSDFTALQGISQGFVQLLCTTVEEAKRQLTLRPPPVQECSRATVADIVFLVDGSSSIGPKNFQEVRQFLHMFVQQLDIGEDRVRVGLVQYSEQPHLEFLLKDHAHKTSILEQVDTMPYRMGGTATGAGITFLLDRVFTKEAGSRAHLRVPQIAVVITDGESADDVVEPAKLLRKAGVIVFAISVGTEAAEELKAIANRPHERFLFSIDNYQGLQRLIQGLLQTVCISMEDQLQALSRRFADIVFLLDSSLSQSDFQQVRTLLVRLSNQLNVGLDSHRLGLVVFGQDTKVEFLLNAHQTKEETLAALKKLRLRTSEPRNLGNALNYTRRNMFTEAAGSRANLGFRQFLVAVTGGNSQDPVSKMSRLLKTDGATLVTLGLGTSTLQKMKLIASAPYLFQTASIAPTLRSIFETEEEVVPLTKVCKAAKLADIVFIVDESRSMGDAGFRLVRGFLYKMVEGLEMDQRKVRVGIVQYSDKPTAQIYLNSFNDKSEMLQFIKMLPYHGGGTKTGAALKFTAEKVFVTEQGSRKAQGVQQVAVVLTAGASQDNVSIAATALRRSGVTVYALGIGATNESELSKIASHPPNKHVFKVEDLSQLKTLEASLQNSLCYNIRRSAVSDSKRSLLIKQGCVQTEEADIFFLIDHSGSIDSADFQDMKKFIIEFVHTFNIGPKHVRVGVVKYASNPQLEFDLTTYTDTKSLEDAVGNIEQKGGGTETGKALSSMEVHFENAAASRNAKVPNYLIVITDGNSADPVKDPAEKLRARGIVIYAIGVRGANETELLQIAGNPTKKFFVNDFDALEPIKNEIVTDICSSEACRDTPEDLMFLIDSSGSIDAVDFQKMKDFMKSVVNKTSIGPNQMHIGVMQFSSVQKVEFSLSEFLDQSSMQRAIDAMQQQGGGTLTGEAITQISQYFDPSSGGRSNVQQTLIVITDGEAQDEVAAPAASLRAKGVRVYAIGVVNANTTQLLEISGAQQRVYAERNFDSLKYLERELTLSICEPEKGERNGTLTLNLTLKPDCQTTEVADIIFLADCSTSIHSSEFMSMLKFMISVVNHTTVGENQVRFGLIRFSTEPQSIFTLNQYYSRREVRSAIDALEEPEGDTFTGKALAYSLPYFDAAHGGRRALKVPQVLMVITDGEATDRYSLDTPAKELRNNGISVFSIGVGNASRDELELIAGGDQSKVFYVGNFTALETLYKNISNVLCNTTKPACEKQKADLVMLIDDSGSINAADYATMKKFMTDLVASFNISQDFVHVGVAQFSSEPQKEFYLNQYNSQGAVSDHITKMTQRGGGTMIGQALGFISQYFQSSTGSRISAGVSQNLVLITDGDSQDGVEQNAMKLRALGIEVFVIGIGDVHDLELLQIAGSPQRFFTVQNFGSLANIKQQVVDTICKSTPIPDPPSCTIDIAMGFDISSERSGSRLLFEGQPQLSASLPEIVHYISSLKGLCCVEPGTPIHTNIGFRVVSREGLMLDDFNFEPYDTQIVNKLRTLQVAQGTAFNPALLQSFKEKFQKQSGAGVKVLVIFSDGLDATVEKMEQESDLLRLSNVSALLVVGLEGVRGAGLLHRVEYGRGFGYDLPLNIAMHGLGSAVLKQIDSVAERECCSVMCKCSGHEGARGQRGPPGSKGVSGPKGHVGYPGEEGVAGERGSPGLMGPQGIQGCPGIRGTKGFRGNMGDRGEEGEHGLDGVNGEQGLTGHAGGAGERGNRGNPGDPGFPGYPGVPGESSVLGKKGDPGPKGNRGTGGNSGRAGEPGVPGDSGTSGHPVSQQRLRELVVIGMRVIMGRDCQLISYIRDNCACSQGVTECPAYPTELVFALDMSEDVTPAAFERMRSALLSLIDGLSITESNCPTGARVAVVSFSAHTKYLVRFQDYKRKRQLVDAVQNIALERTASRRHLGAAMSYVGNNVFKRVRQGLRMRKVAFFFSNGPSEDPAAIVTATMELRGLNIVPAVIALRNSPDVQRAFQADDTGRSILTVLGRPQTLTSDLSAVKHCVICYDPCRPMQQCSGIREPLGPQTVDVDLALVVDGSREVQADQYVGVQQLLVSLLDQLAISPQPRRADGQVRVALVQQSGSTVTQASKATARLEFGLQQYQDSRLMKRHVEQTMLQAGGPSALGQTLEFTLGEVLLSAPSPRRRKLLLAVVGAHTALWDRTKLNYISQKAKCEGVGLLVVTVGRSYNRKQVEELASQPIKQHLLHLGELREGEVEYALRFIRAFLSVLNRGLNEYPPASLKRKCEQFAGQGQGQDPTALLRKEESNVITKDACLLQQEVGSCGNYSLKWFFDPQQSECSRFWYGGCGGNDNRFETQEECEGLCLRRRR
ncbi:collagen alpha-6(VI) chain [Aplochiton taeniatus]